MIHLIIVLILIVAVLLILAVMAQNSKGSGLAGNLGASAATQIMGAKRTTDFLERVTWVFATAIMALSLLANITFDRTAEISSPNMEAAKSKQSKTAPAPSNTTVPGLITPSAPAKEGAKPDSTK